MRIQAKVLLSVFVVAISVTFTFTYFESVKQWKDKRKREIEIKNILLANTLPFLGQAAYDVDLKAFDLIMSGLFQDQSIYQIGVFDEYQELARGKKRVLKTLDGKFENLNHSKLSGLLSMNNIDHREFQEGKRDYLEFEISPTETRIMRYIYNPGSETNAIGYIVMDYFTTFLREELTAILSRMVFNSILSGGFIIILLVFILRHLVVKRISVLENFSQEIGRGNFAAKIDFRSTDEIGVLSRVLDNTKLKLKEFTENLQDLVDKKTCEVVASKRKIEAILKHIELGILTFRSDLKIESELSQFVCAFFRRPKEDVVGSDVVDLLFQNHKVSKDQVNLMRDILTSSIGSNHFSWKINREKVIREAILLVNGEEKYLSFEWTPWINENNEVEKIMLSFRDLTEKKLLEAKIEEERQKHNKTVSILGEMVKHERRDLECVMSEIEKRLLNAINIKQSSNPDPHHIFIELHTMKGVARSSKFATIADLSHEAENIISDWRDGDNLNREKLHEALTNLRNGFSDYKNIFRDFYDTKKDLQFNSLADLVAKSVGELRELLSQEQIIVKGLTIQDKVVEWDMQLQGKVREMIGHALINSADHGFLLPKKKGLVVKEANIAISAAFQGEKIVIEVSDDGVGIDEESIIRAAKKAQVKVEPNQDILELLLHNGFSTAKEVSKMSGRGVGLASIKKICSSLSGNVKLLKNEPRGLTVKMVIFPKTLKSRTN